MNESSLRIIGISGSLRVRSYNRMLLEAAQLLVPDGATLEVIGLRDVPLYNGDHDVEDDLPAGVRTLKGQIAAADAVLFATPEYNHGIPGVLKNALDWVSRPAFRSPLAGKPAGLVSAAPGLLGGARAQEQLRSVLAATMALVMPHRGVVLTRAAEKFSPDGQLEDARTSAALSAYLADLATWTRRVGPAVT
jgi:chromate reductase, NAD(P)H dehydrogenase (quinone)